MNQGSLITVGFFRGVDMLRLRHTNAKKTDKLSVKCSKLYNVII